MWVHVRVKCFGSSETTHIRQLKEKYPTYTAYKGKKPTLQFFFLAQMLSISQDVKAYTPPTSLVWIDLTIASMSTVVDLK